MDVIESEYRAVTQSLSRSVDDKFGLYQVDVIESEYRALLDRMDDAHDFAEVERAHRQYLTALISQTFLDVTVVSQVGLDTREQRRS